MSRTIAETPRPAVASMSSGCIPPHHRPDTLKQRWGTPAAVCLLVTCLFAMTLLTTGCKPPRRTPPTLPDRPDMATVEQPVVPPATVDGKDLDAPPDTERTHRARLAPSR